MPLQGEGHVVAKFDLTLNLREQDEQIVGGLTYAAALYERRTMERHAEYLRNLLHGLVEDATAAVEQLPMLPAAEREQGTAICEKSEAGYSR